MNGGRSNPQLWQHFSFDKTPSKFRILILNNFAALTVPGPCTHREIVEQVAKQSRNPIPIESLSDDLGRSVLPRSVTIFGFPGDHFDRIVDHYTGMKWWISENGLNMAVVPEAAYLSGFNKLAGELAVSKEKNRRLSKDAVLEIATAIDEAGYTYSSRE